jgi:predicted N-formylglutamate amidohydrolase
VPHGYGDLFASAADVLNSHRGYDIGALGVAHRVAAGLSVPILFSTVTRLLVDLNRSLDHVDLFSTYTRGLSGSEKATIIRRFYRPYRSSVTRTVAAAIAADHRVLHVGVHSCADELDGRQRNLDISLLFDEARTLEQAVCGHWREAVYNQSRGLRCPFNEPYRGSDDGLTTTLREQFPQRQYLGVEVEVRQGLIRAAPQQQAVGDLLSQTLYTACCAGLSGEHDDISRSHPDRPGA